MPPSSVPVTTPTSKKLTTTNQHYVEIYSYTKFHLHQSRNARNTGRIKLRPICEGRRSLWGFSKNSKLHDPTSWLGADTRSQIDGRTPFLQENSKGEHKELETAARADVPIVNHICTNNTVKSYVIYISTTKQSSPPTQRWAEFSSVPTHEELEVIPYSAVLKAETITYSEAPGHQLWACTVQAKYESEHCIWLPMQAPHNNARHTKITPSSPGFGVITKYRGSILV